MSFVFSADGHVVEPSDLFENGVPPSLRRFGLRIEKRDDMLYSMAGDRVTLRRPAVITARLGPDGEPFGRPDRRGNREIEYRLKDMEMDGVDAEIVFPTVGLTAFMIENPEAELATAQIYNDWIDGLLRQYPHIFVRCGILPVRDFANTIAEMKRLAALGFTAGMIPSIIDPESGLPPYNDEAWDAVFACAQDLNMVLVMHTGTGRYNVRGFRGAGGAVMNHTIQAVDAWGSVMALVAGGVLDRFPRVHICTIEGGASWLAALAERMDEVYEAHAVFVRPKLSVKPSEVIARQVHCGFQYDRACIKARAITGTAALLWGADYPHHEGTFPNSRTVIAHLFDDIVISEKEKADIIGGNAARLFRLERPEFAGLHVQA